MAKVSRIISPSVPDRAELTSISRLAPAEQIPAQLLKYTPNNLKLKVSCPADGWVLVTDRWAAGWRAKVNGIPADVFGGNLIFRAVRVGTGESTIEFIIRSLCISRWFLAGQHLWQYLQCRDGKLQGPPKTFFRKRFRKGAIAGWYQNRKAIHVTR